MANTNTDDAFKFKEFIETSVVDNEPLFTKETAKKKEEDKKENKGIFTVENLEEVKKFLIAVNDANNTARDNNKKDKNKNERIWGIGDIFDGSIFDADPFKEKENEKNIIIPILLHCHWLMYLCSDRQHKQESAKDYYIDNIDDYYYFNVPVKWAIGQTFSGTSLDAMMFIVCMLIDLKNNSNSDEKTVIGEIKRICKEESYDWDGNKCEENNKKVSDAAIKNVLLYLCKPDIYLPIPAQGKKEAIVEAFKDLIKDTQAGDSKDPDVKLESIKEEILKLPELIEDKNKDNRYQENPFWHPYIRPFWDSTSTNLNDSNLSDETLLEYKKAMILYGPPGTSKSYQARRMAENIIAKALREKYHDNIQKCFDQLQKGALDKHIHPLQLHPNYTYDDFIVGKTISSNSVQVKKGFMLNLIEGINKNKNKDKLPHVVILDEINRVDISRVFGELFTAMEPSYRKKGVKLSVKDKEDLYLKVPENMYFIGTMNMIDFSLEQVDFALRRRFLWRLSTYDEGRLKIILSDKLSDENWLPYNFAENCTKLNNLITREPNLGKDYLIGHAFFAEIVDIYEKVQDWGKAKNILWQISILPTLEAYCGSMDAVTKDKFIENCKNAFMPVEKTT